jgi:uncharacterized protein CbrC (UPF0167 family)
MTSVRRISGASKFDATFLNEAALPDDLPLPVIEEVAWRTPGYDACSNFRRRCNTHAVESLDKSPGPTAFVFQCSQCGRYQTFVDGIFNVSD